MAAMRKADVIATLRAHEAELRSAGVQLLSVFGSVARGDATDASDVDVVIRLSPEAARGGFAYIGRLDALTQRLQDILGCPVDIVAEPVRKKRLQSSLEKGAVLAF